MRASRLSCTLLTFAVLAKPALAAELTQVFINNGELIYYGNITKEANTKLAALDAETGGTATVLAIRSGGGETSAGLELGKWVRTRKLDVKVLEMCFSSCANYVFPAGRKKIVSNFAVVGYHGGLGSASFARDAAEQKARDAMTSAEREKEDAEINKALAEKLAEETAFFRSIGVRPEITLLGQTKYYADRYEKFEKMIGWTYSVADFAKLGVDNITVVNGPWTPRILSGKYTVFSVQVKN
jgi:hypothetical protein